VRALRNAIFSIILVALSLASPGRVSAASPADTIDARASYRFGSDVTIVASMKTSAALKSAFIYIQPVAAATRTVAAEVSSSGQMIARFDLRQQPVHPFTRIYYWIKYTTADGQEYTSPSFWFDYSDNRFTWQTVSDTFFHIYWYKGDAAFGQTIQNVAHASLESDLKLLPLSTPANVDVYVYANADDLRSSLQLGGVNTWAAGNVDPNLGMVMVSAEPGADQKLNLERQIPHELSHVLLAFATGESYSKLPTWLVEGLASQAEMYPNPDYQRSLDAARSASALIPISSLCGGFPHDSESAYLAYAESESFMKYYYDHYGISGLQKLIQSYQDGLGCSEGANEATGSSLRQLEAGWQQETLGIQVGWVVTRNLLPYTGLLVLLVGLTIFAGARRPHVKAPDEKL
jgi:hypothetical protein